MTRLPFAVWDVFTAERFAGNPLAIVENADGLSTARMQMIAREFNLSETIFVCKPKAKDHAASVRIFLPTAEIPFAGHPTIGCAIHLAGRQSSAPPSRLVLEEVAGLVPCQIEKLKNGGLTAQFTAPITPRATGGVLPDPPDAASALGLEIEEIGLEGHRLGRYEGGPEFLFVPVRDRDALARARPSQGWQQLTRQTGTEAVFVYTTGHKGEGIDFHTRMFAPGNGIPEDPATGSASAILAGQLMAGGRLREGVNRFVLEQGRDMGRPSRIGMEAEVTDGLLNAVRISGTAVRVSEGEIETDAGY